MMARSTRVEPNAESVPSLVLAHAVCGLDSALRRELLAWL